MRPFLRRILRRDSPDRPDPRDDGTFYFLPDVRGVLHIGAHYGEERTLYARHGLKVLWVECLPEAFEKLRANLEGFRGQRALAYLLTDREGEEYTFHVSSNEGASSSIFDFGQHVALWPEVHSTHTLTLRSTTLPAMVRAEGVDLADYDALVMDTQGSELLILRGARELLDRFRYVRTEAADFEAYRGGCLLGELDAFMTEAGFERALAKPFAGNDEVGLYYEVVYERR